MIDIKTTGFASATITTDEGNAAASIDISDDEGADYVHIDVEYEIVWGADDLRELAGHLTTIAALLEGGE